MLFMELEAETSAAIFLPPNKKLKAAPESSSAMFPITRESGGINQVNTAVYSAVIQASR